MTVTLREKTQIRKDLTKHLRHKVLQDVDDYIDLCRTSGISLNECVAEIVVFLADFTASFAASQFNIDAAEFGRTMVLRFERAQQEEEAEQ